MRIIALLVLVFGVALSGGALFFASEYFEAMKASMAQRDPGPKTVRVLVAKSELDYGTRLEAKHLQWVEWPEAAVPPGSFTSVEELFGAGGKDSRIVLRPIEPGEPVLASKVTELGESPRMSMNLGGGKRALSVSVDATAGVAGFVQPGDRVDVMLIRTIESDLVSSIIMQDLPVIAVDQRVTQEGVGARSFRMVTFEVDTAQAQKLSLAQQVGRLSLTLRGLGEVSEGDVAPVSADELNDFLKKDPGLSVRVRRAGSLQDVSVDDNKADDSAAQSGDPAAAN